MYLKLRRRILAATTTETCASSAEFFYKRVIAWVPRRSSAGIKMAPPEAKLWVALAQGGKSRANVGDAGGRVFDVTEVTSAVMRVDEMQVVMAGLLRLAKNVDAVLRSYAGRVFAAEKSDAGRR